MVTPMTPAVTLPLNAPAAASPCVDICRLDAQQLCIGCRRTIGEIIEWPRASEARRHEILCEIELRPPPRA
jgi:uncharacterized protein